MKMEGSIVRTIEIDGGPRLAIDTGLGMRQFARAGAARMAAESGTLLEPEGGASPWRIEGTAEIEGRVFAYGPSFPGAPYAEVAETDPAAAIDALRLLCGAQGADAGPAPLLPAAILIGKDGSALLLPEKTTTRALEAYGADAALDGAFRWAHPDLRGGEARAFSAAALAYSLLCGRSPFPARSADEAAADMRDRRGLPSGLAQPGLDPALAEILDGALGLGDGGVRPRPTAAELSAALGKRGSGGPELFLRKPEAAEFERAALERKRYEERAEKAVARKRFWRKNGKLVAGSAAALLALVLTAWSVVSARADRFNTQGLTALQVAQTYYAAYDGLDTEKMEGCVVKGTAKSDIDAATNMFVIFRVRQAYETESPYIRAEDWLKAGSPETQKTVFGITDLRIEAAAENEFTARYRLFGPGLRGALHEDRLTMSLVKGAWRIAELERKILP